MPCVLETGVREQQKYEKRKQTSVGNAGNDMSWKFENRVENKNTFFIEWDISFFNIYVAQ